MAFFNGNFMDQAVAAGVLASNNGVQYDANGVAITDENGVALADPLGSLGGLTTEDGMNALQLYQLEQAELPELEAGVRLQDVYGTGAAPMYNFFNRVPTRTVTFPDKTDFAGVTFEGEDAPFGTAANTDFNQGDNGAAAMKAAAIAAGGDIGTYFGGNVGRFMLGRDASEGVELIKGLSPSESFAAAGKSMVGGAKAPKTTGANVGYGYGAGRAIGGLLAGEDFKDAAKGGVKAGVGAAIGNMILPGIGGFIGASLGGRVICNELQRQGVMSRQNVLLDYRFTKDYLTPQHVNGYHVWAVHVVKQMRKGKGVKLWRHLAQHRANEIAYIYGKRDKPDYLGKIYRKILEPICWSVGFFCEKTDWSVLYKTKEI